MADIEKDMLKRDHRFLIRLGMALGLGVVAGLFLYSGLTGQEVAGCAARAFGGVTEEPPPDG